MASGLVSRWKRDSSLYTFIYTNFVVGLAFSIFSTYVLYQLQITGYFIGTDVDGLPCMTYCIVPFGSQQLDLNTVLLYMNAMTFGIGGAVTILIIAYADFWNQKTLLVSGAIVLYGVLAIPSYWLTDPTITNFNALFALYVVFGVVTSILIALLNIYIPHCMRAAGHDLAANQLDEPSKPSHAYESPKEGKARKYGFAMTIFGMLANNISAALILAIVAILSGTLVGASQQSAGLLVTTVVGFVTVVAAVGSFLGLPALSAKPWPTNSPWTTAIVGILTPFKQLLRRKNMLFLLLAYTIYSDTNFALSSIISQLYFAEVHPDTLEFSLYILASNLFTVICTLAFYLVHRKLQFKLEKGLILGYGLILIVPIWGCIGIADQDKFGDKHRWEFYVQALITSASGSLVNPTFRLLYSELIPAGEEVMWFGLQIVLNCATTWVTYVATGPLQNATHNLRFPLILCVVFLAVPPAMEILRRTLGISKRDDLQWQDRNSHDQDNANSLGDTKFTRASTTVEGQ
ncbi:hypothetical protein JX265_010618 [Neoarthrinium moseri]|uniref:Autophagy-related protein n=1 Tax=Neoarthrinium moseri TaxID=1658444 RepID=A0A9P9WE51_9PEZI|nr:hypothetical protein JX266_007766 [Neoarthrinium moseri]KAI1859141.1 hypothetical protein JX265_010618 [Neoarthrinium moseri]